MVRALPIANWRFPIELLIPNRESLLAGANLKIGNRQLAIGNE